MQLVPNYEAPYMVSGSWRRFAVHVFEGKVTLADMAKIEDAGEQFRIKNPEPIVELVVILPSQSRMTNEERTKMMALIKRWEHKRVASSTVVQAQGLVGALHRSILTGMQMVVPAPHPLKIFGAIAPAVEWLTPFVKESSGPDARAGELTVAIEDLIAHFGRRPVKAPLKD